MFASPVRDFQEKFFSLLSILYVPRAPQIDLFCRGVAPLILIKTISKFNMFYCDKLYSQSLNSLPFSNFVLSRSLIYYFCTLVQMVTSMTRSVVGAVFDQSQSTFLSENFMSRIKQFRLGSLKLG